MATRTVGPNSQYATIAAAMIAAGPNDLIQLEAGYKNETATVTHSGMTIFGGVTSTGIVLQLGAGISKFTLTGNAPINILDSALGQNIVGNAGNNVITVTNGADAVNGGLGHDRLIVDYHLATGAVTGDSTSNFAEAGGSRLVTITSGTFEDFTIRTGSGADTITTYGGDDYVNTGSGAGTVTAGQGSNTIIGGTGADTITALDGGNYIDGGSGTNHITSGGGSDTILSGTGADTIVTGGGDDITTALGGADSLNSGAGEDRLILNYAAMTTNVTGGITGGNFGTGYTGHIADLVASQIDFSNTEHFTITTGSGADVILTGDGADVIRTGDGADKLTGGLGNDLLYGGVGNDVLVGNGGNDIIEGWTGRDYLTGHSGADKFVFKFATNTGKTTATADIISDFKHSDADKVDLSGIDANSIAANNQAFSFIGMGGFTGVAGQLRYSVSGGNAIVSGDVNGDQAIDFVIQLNGVTSLVAGDFVL